MIRFLDGKPLLQSLTSYWMLVQWDWRREATPNWVFDPSPYAGDEDAPA